MSEKGYEPDIEQRRFNVAEVPIPDIPVSVTISMQIGPVATNASSIQPACEPFALASKGLPYRDVMCHASREVGLTQSGHLQSLRTIKSLGAEDAFKI